MSSGKKNEELYSFTGTQIAFSRPEVQQMVNISNHPNVDRKIYLFRGHRVMLDSDLADLYSIETFNLNKAVKRNIERFPAGGSGN